MRRALVVLSIFSLLLAAPLQLWADTEGPNSPGTVANDQSIGTIDWSTVNNAKASDNAYAFASVDSTDTDSSYLKATNFGFTLSSCSSVDGITVENERNGDGFTNVADLSIKIVKGGTISGNEKALGPDWPATDAIATYGGASDLWGVTWNCSDVTGSGFGAAVACQLTGGTIENCRIDHIKITVTFTAGQTKLLITQTRRAATFQRVSAPVSLRSWMPVYKQVSMPLEGLSRFVCVIKPLIVVEPNRSKSWQWMAVLRPTYRDGKKWSYAYVHRKRYERAAQDCNMFHQRFKTVRARL